MVDLAFNEKFHQSLPILSDQQIVHNVGGTPTGATSFYNVQPFVIVPEPSTLALAGLAAGALLLAAKRASSSGDSPAARHWLSLAAAKRR
jgi:hypothetical protein